MEEVLGIFGEVDRSDLLHKAQRIKGNQAGTLHVWFPCSISVRGGGFSGEDQMPEPEVRAAHP